MKMRKSAERCNILVIYPALNISQEWSLDVIEFHDLFYSLCLLYVASSAWMRDFLLLTALHIHPLGLPGNHTFFFLSECLTEPETAHSSQISTVLQASGLPVLSPYKQEATTIDFCATFVTSPFSILNSLAQGLNCP